MSEITDDKNWTFIIRRTGRWVDVNFRELYHYRDLIRLFVRRDFITSYKQTILGPLWFVLNPLFTTIVYTFIFGGLAKIPTDGLPPTLFYYGGTMLWGYFSSCLSTASDTFNANSGLFSKVYFPRLVVPISKAFSNLIAAFIQLGTLICFYLYYVAIGLPLKPNLWLLTIPLIFAQLAALGTGFGMIVCALTTKYRDIRQLISFGISLWMYATPIVYPASQMPSKYKWLLVVNPVSVPIEGFRYAAYGVGSISPFMLFLSVCITLFICFFGTVLFTRSERTFVDVV